MQTVNIDVLIVGAGPTGLTLAALLARGGANVTAITRYRGLANSPRAHIINQRTMEVFRDLGIEERVTAEAMPAGLMGQVIWAESFTGPEIGRRHGWGAGADRMGDYAQASPCLVTNIPQHVLEPILCDTARESGAEVEFGQELVSMRQEPDRVVSICGDRATDEEIEVVSRYAVGADGDNSTVCREIGFEVQGETSLGDMLNYWFEADLTRYAAHRAGALYQIFRPSDGMGVDNAMFVNIRPWTEWVMSVPYDLREGMPDLGNAAVKSRVREFVGDDTLEVRPISTSTWTINQVHAELMHSGRVAIAGNAAHRHPPAGGLGANTCVQDAFNLGWKLQQILAGNAGPDLLASYTAERAPVARRIVHRANTSLDALMAIPTAIGLLPSLTAEQGRDELAVRFTDTEEGRRRRSALTEALRIQDYNFNAIGVELGQFYTDSPMVVPDGVVRQPASDPELFYDPSTTPGSPLPHAWITRGSVPVSSLDIVGHGRFTVLTGSGGAEWKRAAAALTAETGIAVAALSIGAGCDTGDPYGEWQLRSGLHDDGCLLVRPDRHVAFRAQSASEDAEAQLRTALFSALGYLPVAA
jgi:2,4-dichlorophenol 6-monooxygenase